MTAPRTLIRSCTIVLGLLFVCRDVLCAPVQNKTAADADAAYQVHNWQVAGKLYELTKKGPSIGRNCYRLGLAAQNAGDHQTASTALHEAQAKGAAAMAVEYNLACVHASLGQREEALRELVEAVKQGYAQPEQMQADSDLQSLRSDAQFFRCLNRQRRTRPHVTTRRRIASLISGWESGM